MQIQNVPITSVKPYEKNPRFNDDAVDAVAKSIKEFGWQQPIVTDKDMTVICGHTRLKAAERLGLTEVPVIVADNLTPEQVKAYRIADNKTGELAEWNYDLLPFEIKDLQDANFDLSLLGFDTDELDKLLNGDADKAVATGETSPDAVPEAPEVAVSVRGEVYQLGEHRLMCGDSTDPTDTAKLLGEDKAILYLVDPPYNVALQGSNGLTIQNDDMPDADFRKFLNNAFRSRHKIVYPSEVNEAPVIVALARAFRWQKFIDDGRFKNIRQLAKAVGLDESVVGATLRLRWLAPGLVHDILNGGCKDMSLKQLRHGVPELWREQVPGMVSSEVEA